MSWISKIFKKGPETIKAAPGMNGFLPLYSQYGVDVYSSDVVQQAIKCIVDELKKLNPMHIRQKGNDPVPVKGNIQDILDCPNEVMTTSEFIEKTMWMLMLNYNAFIVPTYITWTDEGEERRRYDGLYPLNPCQVDFIEDASGTLFVKFWFRNGTSTIYPYSDVIHIKYNYSVNDYMGGDMMGQPDHRGLAQTVELNKKLLEGVAKAMNSSYQINGIIKYGTILDREKIAVAIAELEEHLRRGESGFLPMDLRSEYIPIQKQIELVDDKTLEFIDSKILRNWGVPLAILTGDYTRDQYAAFYQKCLEPIIISFSQALTKKMFTRREIAFGNKIKLYPKELIFMTMSQTIEMIKELSPTGALFENEKRAALGMMPLPELENKRYMSLNWIEADKASQYQVGTENIEVVDKEDM